MLRGARDAHVAAQSRRFFKKSDKASFYGVRMPQVRKLARAGYAQIEGQWILSDAVQFAGLMLQSAPLEAKVFGLLTLSRFETDFQPRLLATAERWLRSNYCDNWATVDALCPLVITPLVVEFPQLIPRVERWVRAKNLWVRRAAAVTFVPLARRGSCLDPSYRVATALLGDRHDLIHKATGWLLREAGKTDTHRLSGFLIEHGPRIPRTTVRYAIERFPEAQRIGLLKRTASRGG